MPDKPLFFVRHARNKIRLWKIERADIETALDHPEHQAPTTKNRVNYWRAWRGQWLQVTVVDEGTRMVIVSVTPKRKIPR